MMLPARLASAAGCIVILVNLRLFPPTRRTRMEIRERRNVCCRRGVAHCEGYRGGGFCFGSSFESPAASLRVAESDQKPHELNTFSREYVILPQHSSVL